MSSLKWGRLLATAAAATWIGACSESTRPVAPTPGPAEATSDRAAVALFEWAVNRSAPDVLERLFAGDFALMSAEQDSAGNSGRGALERDSVLIGFRAMLEGVPGRYPPAEANLSLDRILLSFPDARGGRDPQIHRTIRTHMALRVHDVATGSVFDISGSLVFLATRGDSAAVPMGTVAEPDSTRWWIASLEDEAVAGPRPGASAHPSMTFTLRTLLDFYRARAASP